MNGRTGSVVVDGSDAVRARIVGDAGAEGARSFRRREMLHDPNLEIVQLRRGVHLSLFLRVLVLGGESERAEGEKGEEGEGDHGEGRKARRAGKNKGKEELRRDPVVL